MRQSTLNFNMDPEQRTKDRHKERAPLHKFKRAFEAGSLKNVSVCLLFAESSHHHTVLRVCQFIFSVRLKILAKSACLERRVTVLGLLLAGKTTRSCKFNLSRKSHQSVTFLLGARWRVGLPCMLFLDDNYHEEVCESVQFAIKSNPNHQKGFTLFFL